MFSCAEYQVLDEISQAKFIWIDGRHLSGRKTERLNVELFVLYNFYVEIFFFKENDEPLYIKSFENINHLKVYLEE